jgi:DUF971 family protein
MATPVEMGSVADRQFTVTWSDGHRSTYAWVNLRISCPCAGCSGEWSYRPPKLTPEDVGVNIRAMSVSRVGAYALRFVWSGGHDSGLYTFDSLRNKLCECDECVARRAKPAPGRGEADPSSQGAL